MIPDSAPTSIQVGKSDIPFASHARNPGITISSNTTMDKHVTSICRSAYTELRRISSICHLLTVNATKTLLSAFVLSKLDYCNSLLCGPPQFILDKLQRVHNSAARLAMKFRKCDHVQSLLHNLHWPWSHGTTFHHCLLFTVFTEKDLAMLSIDPNSAAWEWKQPEKKSMMVFNKSVLCQSRWSLWGRACDLTPWGRAYGWRLWGRACDWRLREGEHVVEDCVVQDCEGVGGSGL